jgi:hypothetical protein
MAGVRSYSITPANNATIDGVSYWPESMAPSAVNDAARFMCRDLAEMWELLSGTLTTAGSANAQTLTPTRAWTAYTNGDRVVVRIGSDLTNTGSATLNVSGLGAKNILKRDGVTTLSAGDLAEGGLYEMIYLSAIGAFVLLGEASSLDAVTSAGSDVASASTIDLSAAKGGIVDVTGTTTITAVTLADGDIRFVRFTGALTLTHGASLVLPGSANITTAAGDWAIFVGDASSVVRCLHYQRISGGPTVPATASDLTSGGNSKIVTPGTIKRYTSTGPTITAGGTLTLAHGLGATPYFVHLSIKMGASTELGYSEDEEVPVGPNYAGTEGLYGSFAVVSDETNVKVYMSSALNISVPNRASSNDGALIDKSKWTLVVRASL